jgi:L-2-hydroxyglutarate oxidase LhgO
MARRRSRATPHKPFSEHSARSERIVARSRRLPGQAPDYRLAVIGGGIVGLAAAYQLLLRKPGLSLALVEKEPDLATQQSGHNSGVLHAGLHYVPGSRKARLCREGKAAVEKFAEERGIPYRHREARHRGLGRRAPRLVNLAERARANGVDGLEEVGPERIREIEPSAAGIRALWSPKSGIIDYRRVALAYAEEIRARGGAIFTGRKVLGIEAHGAERIVRTSGGDLVCGSLITCAGLYSDRVAAMTGAAGNERIVPFRGDYYTLVPAANHLVRGLIYPVPDPRFPFLGVHFGLTMDGRVRAGPNAVLAFAREGYRRTDVSLADLSEMLGFPGFRRFARKHWRTGLAEMWRDWSKRTFLAALRRYIPEIRGEDLVFGPSGVRAQSLAADGTLVEDFSIGESPGVLHVRNAPSPAATASLAIGREISEMAIQRFGLQ